MLAASDRITKTFADMCQPYLNGSIMSNTTFPPHDLYYHHVGIVSWGLVPWCHEFFRRPTTAPFLALSFDDGPSTRSTAKILEILDRFNAHATFFVVGHQIRKPGYANLGHQILSRGHEIGHHSTAHRSANSGGEAGFMGVVEDFHMTVDLFQQHLGMETVGPCGRLPAPIPTGEGRASQKPANAPYDAPRFMMDNSPTGIRCTRLGGDSPPADGPLRGKAKAPILQWYRPPMGHTNPSLTHYMAERCGVSTVTWDVNTRDWEIGQAYGVSESLESTLSQVHPGAVLLLHDRRPDTIQLLPLLLEGLRKLGYRDFLSMTEWRDRVTALAGRWAEEGH
ncbi:hypothetical protein PAPYR_5135 [Paratrimastix pyriformis]|uniref:NodB homology domain-containing protein n=1 Tax=Paratrimastix pyriformis TaxID=342808 RepID=A0ABQ8UQT8_9EUKA|nr:hypothetical protein PAPYR_5135 [Paratrimastix pyriformis]